MSYEGDKVNRKGRGFVVSAVLYPLLVLFLALIMGLLAMSDTRKRILDKMKLEISDSIFDDAECSCDTILNKLNYLIKNGVGGGGGGFSSGLGSLSVTAYETGADIPANGDINDIAVITTNEITDYKVTPYEPENPKEGTVWIRMNDNPKAHIMGSNITVPITRVDQYLEGAWRNVPGFIYTNDAKWVPLSYSSLYTESILNGADPELYQGLIPIEISDTGVITRADTGNAWYSYADKKWANAVLISGGSYAVGEVIPESAILMYYVWIPRYKYQLFNAGNGSIAPKQIEIVFGDKGTDKVSGAANGEWLTHPAFTFGNTELNGFWVAKFETTGSAGTNTAPHNLTSKPGLTSWRNINVVTMFNAARAIDTTYATSYGLKSSEIDTHMMKNMEWGAMAYLSHSQYGTCTNGTCTEITYNSSEYLTGGSNSKTAWANTYMMQSTTRNRYGVYDTSGGAWEYVMGNMTNSTTEANSSHFYSSNAGFSAPPEDKYVDYYTYDTSHTTHARGKLGDATKETLQTFGSNTGGWHGDYASFPYATYSWFIRGGDYGDGATATGVFAFYRNTGQAYTDYSFRVVLSAQ